MKIRTLLISALLISNNLWAAPAKNLDSYWQRAAATEKMTVDHSAWQQILDKYLSKNQQQQTFFNYKSVNNQDAQLLKSYIKSLQDLNPLELTRVQQKAYWINLYNAATVSLILDNRPVKSITKLGSGLFAFGPWDDKLLIINSKKVSLNDIEHRILRPIYNDARIHYAVNCASFSCPNLATKAYTKSNTEALLELGAKEYVNHTRGVSVTNKGLVLSTIYDWYQTDFGKNEAGVVKHLQKYAKPALAEQLAAATAKKLNIKYEYNWDLNQTK